MLRVNQLVGFGAGLSTGYVANAVNFDGSTYLNRAADLTGAANGPDGSSSIWVKFDVAGDGAEQEIYHNTDNGVKLRRVASGTLRYQFRSAAAAQVIDITSTSTWDSNDGWINILCSWDVNGAAGDQQLYVNDVDDKAAETFTTPNIDYTKADHALGAIVGGTAIFDGDMADAWFSFDTAQDFSVAGNRRRFIDAFGKPVDLGATGERPIGGSPIAFFSGDVAAWHTNKGSGGGFTENGALTTASSSPSD